MSDEESKAKPVELVDDPEDPELSELLDSALADFGRPVPSAPAAKSAAPASSAAAGAAAAPPAAATADAENVELGEAYKTFEEAMKQVIQVNVIVNSSLRCPLSELFFFQGICGYLYVGGFLGVTSYFQA